MCGTSPCFCLHLIKTSDRGPAKWKSICHTTKEYKVSINPLHTYSSNIFQILPRARVRIAYIYVSLRVYACTRESSIEDFSLDERSASTDVYRKIQTAGTAAIPKSNFGRYSRILYGPFKHVCERLCVRRPYTRRKCSARMNVCIHVYGINWF